MPQFFGRGMASALPHVDELLISARGARLKSEEIIIEGDIIC